MAAVPIRVARVGFLAVNSRTGAVIDKNNPSTTVNDVMQTSHQHRVLQDITNAPNSTGNPTVDDYLRREAGDGYVVRHMDQNMIVTYQGV